MVSTLTPDRSAEPVGQTGARSAESPAPILCPQCGGSGILRMGDQQFRTCLDCLGQGQLSRTVQQELLFPSLSLSVSAAREG